MKLITFLPWMAYGILSSVLPQLALPIALICFLFSYRNFRNGFILEWGSFLIFITLFINFYVFKNQWLFQHLSILISFFFVAIAAISILIRSPFTMQYAKLEVDRKFWNSPFFLRVNQIMTAILGMIFLSTALINLYRFYRPGILNGWFIWPISTLAQLLVIHQFPKWYRKRYLRIANEDHSN